MRQRLLSRKHIENLKKKNCGQTKEFENEEGEKEKINEFCQERQGTPKKNSNNDTNINRRKKNKKKKKNQPKMVCEKAMFSPCHKYRTQCTRVCTSVTPLKL